MTQSSSNLLSSIASDAVIDQAYHRLCRQRKNYPANADIWGYRLHWKENRPTLINELNSACYQFSPQQRITKANGAVIHVWSAKDALVLKALAIVLGPRLPISPQCTHVKGHGGLKGALRWLRWLRWLRRKSPAYHFVFRSDVKGYYAHINHGLLLDQLQKVFPQAQVYRLLTQVIRRQVEWGGTFREVRCGIGRGCPLSPLFAALYLKPLDDAMDIISKGGVAYVRYMDDWVILTRGRWGLRKAIRLVNQTLAQLKLNKHPDKTWMGPIDRGFDFVGYHHSRAGCIPAAATLKRFKAHIAQLKEQGTPPARIGVYETSWWRWVVAGLAKNSVLVNPSDHPHGMAEP